MKQIILFLLCCTVTLRGFGTETNSHAIALLRQAFHDSRNQTFTASWFEPVEYIDNNGPRKNAAQVVQYAPNRQRDYLQLRLESPTYLLTECASGSFASLGDREYRILRSLPVVVVDQLFHAPSEEELNAAVIDSDSAKFNGMECWRITMETPREDAVLQKLLHVSPDNFQAHKEEYWAERSIRKVFFIEKAHSLIVGRRHYDQDNKLQYQSELRNVNWQPQLEPFVAPESAPVLLSLQEFGRENQVAAKQDAVSKTRHLAVLQRLLRQPGGVAVGFGIVAVVALSVAFWLKRRRR